MEVDMLKTNYSSSSGSDSSSSSSGMDMMAMMMMQIEKFPELLSSDPFYNNSTTTTLTYPPQNDQFSATTTTTNTLPVFSNINPSNVNVAVPPANFTSNPTPSSSNFIHHSIPNYQQPMTPPSFQLINEISPGGKLRASHHNNTNSIPLLYPSSSSSDKNKNSSMAAMREMIFRVAVMQPIHIDPESIKPPKRRNVKISKDPQSVAARHRRERISERIRILQRLVPGGTKMDTASMLDEAIHYVKFLKKQVQTLEQAGAGAGAGRPISNINNNTSAVGFTGFSSSSANNVMNYSAFLKGCHQPYPMLGSSSAPSKQLLS